MKEIIDYIKNFVENIWRRYFADNGSKNSHFKQLFWDILNLMLGMCITLLNMFRKKATEPYPENRNKKVHFERFRAHLTMPHNSANEHKCTACGICAINCPNDSIQIISKKELDETTGKEKRVLDKYLYDLGSCTFCDLCTSTCPQDAIAFTPAFEHSMFTRSKLVKLLNKEGSKLEEKQK